MYLFLNESMSNFSKMFKIIIETWKGITFSCKYLSYVNVGHRWNNHDKAIALALYFRSHQAYRVLNKLFSMLSASTSICQRYSSDKWNARQHFQSSRN